MLHRLSRAFALAGALPLILLSILSLVSEIPHFFNPCFTFGATAERQPYVASCRGRSAGTSETRLGMIVRLTLVQGTAMFMAALALKGAYRRKPQLIVLAAVLMFFTVDTAVTRNVGSDNLRGLFLRLF